MFFKKYSLLFILLIILVLTPNTVNATSGCCSHHGGVDCSRKQANGQVICGDGWTGSSCSYSSMAKCSNYSLVEDDLYSDNDINSNESKSDNNLWYIIGGVIIIYFYCEGSSVKRNKNHTDKSHSNVKKPDLNNIINRKVDANYNDISANIPDTYDIFKIAIKNNLKMTIKYVSQKNKITTREIIPKEIYGEYNNYYLRAFCLLRNEERVFKISRIIEVKLNNESK